MSFEKTEKNLIKKTLIFHLNEYPDGLGDMGNLIDFSKKMIELVGKENVVPYFVISSNNNEKSVSRLKASMSFDISNNIFTFEREERGLRKIKQFSSDNFFNLVNSSNTLKSAYANADGVYFIATPFDVSQEKLKTFLKKETETITVTEHMASSYVEDFTKRKSLPPYHYVTGIGQNYAGMMVSDLSSTPPVEALLSISDKSYLSKLGLSENPSEQEASHFLENTLVVPIYLGSTQVDRLRPILNLILHSKLAAQYKKVIFHINSSAHQEEHFNCQSELMPLEGALEFNMIIGHYFDDPNDYEKIYKLAPKGGIAVCSGDKSLELTVSSGLMPLYVPPMWKKSMSQSLINYVEPNTEHGQLLEFCSLSSDYMADALIYDKKTRDSLYSSLTQNTCQTWKETKRPQLLENSFYQVMAKDIAPRCFDKQTTDETISNQNQVSQSVFSTPKAKEINTQGNAIETTKIDKRNFM